MIRTRTKPVFKISHQKQTLIFPPSLEELIADDHPVRIVDDIINKLNLTTLYNLYPGGGASSYDPASMLKLLIYAYINNNYSSRNIEAACKENVNYMWLTGMQKPDHNTINSFRNGRMKVFLKEAFSQIVILLYQANILDIKDLYTDGTILEADANKYTFVWAKSIKYNKTRILNRLDEIWQQAEKVTKKEIMDTRPTTIEELSPESVMETIEKIQKHIDGHELDKATKRKLYYSKTNDVKNIEKYIENEKILGERNSYSKTDHDAVFMRTKDDHFKNGQLKPCYNLQISTNNQYIVDYTIHQNPADITTMVTHLMDYKTLFGFMPDSITTDKGYGSEENYEFAERYGITAFVGNNMTKSEKSAKKLCDPENLYYDSQGDYFICPMGQKMQMVSMFKKTTKTGYEQNVSYYQAQRCDGCPLRGACNKSKDNKRIEINHNAWRHRREVDKRLSSPEGVSKLIRRSYEPENVFGNIKNNKKFRRFNLRGSKNVETEIGIISLAHNISKFARKKGA